MKNFLILLLLSASLFITCSNNPANPYDKSNTKIFLFARSIEKTLSSTGIEDSVGNTIEIGFNCNLPSNVDSVHLIYTVQNSGISTSVTFGDFKVIPLVNNSDTLWDSIVFSDSGTKIISGIAYISNNTTVSDSIVATIHARPVNHKPELFVNGNNNIYSGQTCTLAVVVKDSDAAQSHAFSTLKKPAGSSFEDQIFIWTPSSGFTGKDTAVFAVVDNGYPVMSDTYTVLITVKDTAIDTVTTANHPPVWQADTIKQSGSAGSKISLTLSADCSDADGDLLTYTLMPGIPAGDTIIDGIWSFTPGAGDTGIFYEKIIAKDPSGLSDTVVLHLIIEAVDTTAPQVSLITPSKDTVSTNASSYTITLKCKDASGIASVIGVVKSVSDTGTKETDSTYTMAVSNLAQGVFDTVKIIVTDNSKRANKTTINVMIKYDSTLTDNVGPTIKKISGPDDTVSSSSITIIDSIYDPSGVDSVTATLNSTPKVVLVGTGNLYTYSGTLSEGSNTIVVASKDKSAAGNIDTQTTKVVYIIAPSISTQPSGQTICPGSSVTLTVIASGTSPLIYKWYKGTTRVGTTDSISGSFSISSMALTDTGYYKVTVSNWSGTVTSDSVKIAATKYYVAFISNGGTTVDTQWIACGAYATAPTSPTKSGYKFTGWYTNAELTSNTFDFSSSSNVITTNRTLYAGWVKTCKLTFNSQSAETAASPDTMIVVTGKTVDSLPTAPTKTGCTFAGWWTGVLGTGDSFTTSKIITADDTLHARWTIKDYDNNVYNTITIGTHTWTVENLRATTYKSGNSIQKVTDSATWANLATAGYCYYNNTTNADSIKKFGALYNWYAADSEIFISGWHVPTDSEWTILQNYLTANGYNYDSTTTDNKIAKSLASQTDWSTSTTTGTPGNDITKNNSSGFSALSGGQLDNYFSTQGYFGFWWSASEYGVGGSLAYCRFLNYNYVSLGKYYYKKICGFSVRLLRD